MRGGLGRILLTAFMLLAIVPLSVVSYLAIVRVQKDMRQAAMDNLALVATSKAEQLQSWLDARGYGLSALTDDPIFREAVRHGQWGDACRILEGLSWRDAGTMAFSLWSADGRTALCTLGDTVSIDVSRALSLTVSVVDEDNRPLAILAAYPYPRALGQAVHAGDVREGQRIRLMAFDELDPVSTADGFSLVLSHPPGDERWLESTPDDAAVWAVYKRGGGFYDDASGVPMMGAFGRLPGRQVALLVEESEEMVTAREDDLAAMLIGSTLAVALLTTVLAAVITRQLTGPIVRLTMSAVQIARGDLSQTVEIDRRDEIGILARAFNIMTAELRSVYSDLERKVAERTSQLTEANRQLRYQAMQLRLSAEVGRVATSILDLDVLLECVTQLILDSYAHVYYVDYVAVLLGDEFGEWVERQVWSGRDAGCGVSLVAIGDDCPVGQTAADGLLRTFGFDNDAVEVAVPLRIGSRVIGVLDLYCSRRDTLSEDDVSVLQSLGDQISVAIENARIYAIEREAVERLSRLDHMRLASLGVGSRELATELNTIIGFSRLILKGADGPLTDLQHADLTAIYKSGYRLLGLIDNVITLSELEGGVIEPERQAVDLEALLEEVLTAAKQRLVEANLTWHRATPLPLLCGDVSLLRQAFLGLITAVAEQATQDNVAVRAYVDQDRADRVCVCIGNGDARQEKETADGILDVVWNQDMEEMSVGLALARQVVALHSGEMRLGFDVEKGLNGVVLLPVPEGWEANSSRLQEGLLDG
jgi:signal transduction histidine kinase